MTHNLSSRQSSKYKRHPPHERCHFSAPPNKVRLSNSPISNDKSYGAGRESGPSCNTNTVSGTHQQGTPQLRGDSNSKINPSFSHTTPTKTGIGSFPNDKQLSSNPNQKDSELCSRREEIHLSFSNWLLKANSRNPTRGTSTSPTMINDSSSSSRPALKKNRTGSDLVIKGPRDAPTSMLNESKPIFRGSQVGASKEDESNVSTSRYESRNGPSDFELEDQDKNEKHCPTSRLSASATSFKPESAKSRDECLQKVTDKESAACNGDSVCSNSPKNVRALPREWLLRKMTLSDWQSFRDAVFIHGDEVSKLAFKIVQELMLSPSSGIAEDKISAVSALFDNIPHYASDEGDTFIHSSSLPEHLRQLITKPVTDMFGRHALHSLSSSPFNYNVRKSPVSFNGHTEEVIYPENLNEVVADKILSDNIRYFFDYMTPGSTSIAGDTGRRTSSGWRGRPDHSGRGIVNCSPERRDELVCLDPLYTQIMRDLYRDYIPPRSNSE